MDTPYRSVWYERDIKDWCVSTRNEDGSPRTIDDCLAELKRHSDWREATQQLHDWKGSAYSGLCCTKCGCWCNTWHTPPVRGCKPARPELSTVMIVAPRLNR